MSALVCGACSGPVYPDDVFCVGCGTRVPELATIPAGAPTRAHAAATGVIPIGRPCAGCGVPTLPDDHFCQHCGTRLGTDAPDPTPTAPDGPLACPGCGDSLFSDEIFCVSCGTRVSFAAPAEPGTGGRGGTRVLEALRAGKTAITPQCPTCGVGTVPGDPFCTSCGTKLQGVVVTDAVPVRRTEGAGAAEIVIGGKGKDAADDAWDEVRRKLEAATIGEYDIARELGRGGMAAVYLAHDIALNRKVAIKVMAPGLLLGRGMVERFSREAQTVANLSHPNIIQIYTVRHIDDLHFFVMKYVEGNSLQLILEQVGPLQLPIIRQVLYQIGSGLAYAHKRGIVHRDIKPANILIDTDGSAVVMDFGIAKVAEEGGPGGSGMTQAGTVVGTPAYMSPEQCYSAEVTWSADQYSLGIVGYEMLTGRPPFDGSPFEVMQAHTQDDAPPIRSARRDCPSAVETAVLTMLEKKAVDRHATMAAALDALGALPASPGDPVHQDMAALARITIDGDRDGRPATPRSPAPGIRRSVRRRGRSNGRLIGIGSVATLGVVAAAVWYGTRGAPAPVPELTRVGAVPVARIGLSARRDSVLVDATVSLKAVVSDSAGSALADRTVVWRSADSTVATVSGQGLEATITGKKAGRVVIVAESEGRRDSAEIAVLAPRRSALSVSTPKKELVIGEQAALAAILTDSLGKRDPAATFTWRSASPNVVEVSATGAVTAKASGRARVNVTSGTLTGFVDLSVRGAKATAITLFPPSGTLSPGRSVRVRAQVTWDGAARGNAAAIVWHAEPAGIATIAGADSAGATVALLKEGEVAITAQLDGVRGSTGLVVKAATAVGIDLSKTAVTFESAPDGSPAEQSVTVAARGVEEAPAIGKIEYGEGDGWLSAQVQGTIVTLKATPRGLPAGTYRASLPITAGPASRALGITLTVTAPAATAGVGGDLESTRDALQGVLDRYARALVARDSTAIRDLYPGISQRGMTDIVKAKVADQYEIQLRRTSPLRAGAQEGSIEGDVSAGVFTGGGSNVQRLIYQFVRAGGGWKIAGVRAAR